MIVCSYFTAVAQDYHIQAGDELVINVSDYNVNNEPIWIKGNFGTSLIKVSPSGKIRIPKCIIDNAGIYNWYYNKDNNGIIKVSANQETKNIEQYYGPIKVIVEDNESAEILTILTDSLDNIINYPSASVTAQYKTQLKSLITNSQEYYSNAVIPSEGASGKKIISTRTDGIPTSEKEIKLTNRSIKNFKITSEIQSDYADGHQLMKLSTDAIQYIDGETIIDGTIVSFNIKTSEGKTLFTQGITINGIAEAYIIHPDRPMHWNITASVSSYKISESITVSFKEYIQEFVLNVVNDKLIIGPVIGPQGQYAHDGTRVYISYHYENRISQETLQLKNGNSTIQLDALDESIHKVIVKIGAHIKEYSL
jgi:hypothetical protein